MEQRKEGDGRNKKINRKLENTREGRGRPDPKYNRVGVRSRERRRKKRLNKK